MGSRLALFGPISRVWYILVQSLHTLGAEEGPYMKMVLQAQDLRFRV